MIIQIQVHVRLHSILNNTFYVLIINITFIPEPVFSVNHVYTQSCLDGFSYYDKYDELQRVSNGATS